MLTQDFPSIGIDCRFAATKSGIGRYTRELVKHLLKRDDPWRYVFFTVKKQITGLQSLPFNAKVSHFPLSTFHYSFGEQIELPRAIRKTNVALFHSPHFNVPWFCPVPFIATIHDLILHRFPNQAPLPHRLLYKFLMKHTVQQAAGIIAVSKYTADEIANEYGEDLRSKISVTYEGVAEEFQPCSEEEKKRVREKHGLPHKFLLYVGASKEHKNVQTLIDACTEESPPLILVTGGKEVARLRLQRNVRLLTDIANEDLPALYSSAECFVLPSLAEGFGLPLLEAMACGCKVVASNRTSIPEIAGEHAVFVEPTLQGLKEGIGRALTQKKEGEKLVAHAQKFTWEYVAEETAKVYAAILKHGPHLHTTSKGSQETWIEA